MKSEKPLRVESRRVVKKEAFGRAFQCWQPFSSYPGPVSSPAGQSQPGKELILHNLEHKKL